MDGNNYTKKFIEKFGIDNTLIVSADIENQINSFDENEKNKYMKMIGLENTGLGLLIKKGYSILELDTFFTSSLKKRELGQLKKLLSSRGCRRNTYRF